MNKLKIGLDIDQVIADFWNPYLERFGIPKSGAVITKHCQNNLKYDKEFWTTLPIINIPDFTPTLFCTKRVNPKSYTKQYLKDKLGLTNIPIYQMYYQHGNKARMIKGRVDVFVDDSIDNFIKMNLAGVPCLLMDSESNQNWGPIGRIYSLNYDEIESTYNLFMNTVFSNFKNLINESLYSRICTK